MGKFAFTVEIQFEEINGEQRVNHSQHVVALARDQKAGESLVKAWAESEFDDIQYVFIYGGIDLSNAPTIGISTKP